MNHQIVTDNGEEVLRVGDAAGIKAGDTNGHCLRNRSNSDAYVLEIGTRSPKDFDCYPDMDVLAPAEGRPITHRMRANADVRTICIVPPAEAVARLFHTVNPIRNMPPNWRGADRSRRC